MYKLLTALRSKLQLSQGDFAKVLHTDQAQISRLESGKAGKSFDELCTKLRLYARENPRAWLELLAAGDPSTTFVEYLDLFFITERLRVDFEELWVVSELPAECQHPSMREVLADHLKRSKGVTSPVVVYWVPDTAFGPLRTLGIALNKDHAVSEDLLERVFVIRTPARFTLLPMAVVDPRQEGRLGVLSPEVAVGRAVRVVVLPTQTTARLVQFLEPIYRALQVAKPGISHQQDGHDFRRQNLREILENANNGERSWGKEAQS